MGYAGRGKSEGRREKIILYYRKMKGGFSHYQTAETFLEMKAQRQ
jgi:hypothetical protein